MIAPEARMRIWLKKNDVCMSARTNRIANARLKFGSNDARKHLAASPLTNYLTKPYTRCIEVVPTYYHSIHL